MNPNVKYAYYFTNPQGEPYDAIYNITEFCRINGLNDRNIRKVCSGKCKSHKGWKVFRNKILFDDIQHTVDIFGLSKCKSGHKCLCSKKTESPKDNVLTISDLHIPFENKYALEFVKDIYKKYNCNKVVALGDIFDIYSLSRYTKSPSSMNVVDEFEESKQKIKEWVTAFPTMECIIGNHEARLNKKLSESGIPKEFVKSFNELFGLPDTWKWYNEFTINDVTYLHGDRSGALSYISICKDMRKSIVCAHTHFSAGIQYLTNSDSTIFALNCGCMIDFNSYAFSYASSQAKKPVLGTGVVLGNLPIFIPMS